MMQHGIHSTFDTHSALSMDHYERHSGSFNVIHCHHSQCPNCLARCSYNYLPAHYHCHTTFHRRHLIWSRYFSGLQVPTMPPPPPLDPDPPSGAKIISIPGPDLDD